MSFVRSFVIPCEGVARESQINKALNLKEFNTKGDLLIVEIFPATLFRLMEDKVEVPYDNPGERGLHFVGVQSVPIFLLQLMIRATIEKGNSQVGIGWAMKDRRFFFMFA